MAVPRLRRRTLMGAAAAAVLGRTAGAAPVNAVFPDGATLLIAGPGGGAMDLWAEWLTPALARALPPSTPVLKDLVGGPDGVTGANQFEARTVPDGSTALLVPGSAAMAWLVGDPRARYDAGHWIPAMAGVASGVIASRLPLAQIMAGAPVRIAASGPAGPELPAMLALDLLGAQWQPVFGAGPGALGRGLVDVVFLYGRGVPEAARAAAAAGAPPIVSLGVVDDEGRPQHDPSFAGLPDASELLAGRVTNPKLLSAWQATASAAVLEMALVLPQPAPAAMVALWRRACRDAAGSLQSQASTIAVRPLGSPAANAVTSAAIPDAAVLLELRRWLATRLDYHPA